MTVLSIFSLILGNGFVKDGITSVYPRNWCFCFMVVLHKACITSTYSELVLSFGSSMLYLKTDKAG